MPNDAADRSDEPLLEGMDASLIDVCQLPASADALRQRLLVETAIVVRGRRRRRVLVRSLAACLCYAAGLATAWALLPREQTEQNPQTADAAIAEMRRDEATVAATESVQPPQADDESNDPWKLRQQVAKATRSERIRLLRKAGDLYLVNSGDVESALNCYRQLLELTPRSQRTSADPDDTWLLAELKLARHDPLKAAGINQ